MKAAWLSVERAAFNTSIDSAGKTRPHEAVPAPTDRAAAHGQLQSFQQQLSTGERGLAADNGLSAATHFPSGQTAAADLPIFFSTEMVTLAEQ